MVNKFKFRYKNESIIYTAELKNDRYEVTWYENSERKISYNRYTKADVEFYIRYKDWNVVEYLDNINKRR